MRLTGRSLCPARAGVRDQQQLRAFLMDAFSHSLNKTLPHALAKTTDARASNSLPGGRNRRASIGARWRANSSTKVAPFGLDPLRPRASTDNVDLRKSAQRIDDSDGGSAGGTTPFKQRRRLSVGSSDDIPSNASSVRSSEEFPPLPQGPGIRSRPASDNELPVVGPPSADDGRVRPMSDTDLPLLKRELEQELPMIQEAGQNRPWSEADLPTLRPATPPT